MQTVEMTVALHQRSPSQKPTFCVPQVGVPRAQRMQYARDILQKELLPHVGQGQYCETKKAYYIGYIVSSRISSTRSSYTPIPVRAGPRTLPKGMRCTCHGWARAILHTHAPSYRHA